MKTVLVINHNNQTLAPTHPARARKLLSSGRATIISRSPFTIRLARKFDTPPAHILELVDRGATFVVNHSGGKDSQAMAAYVRSFVPDSQILILHAPLGEVEWEGCPEHIAKTTKGLKYREAKAVKTFFEMVDRSQKWPKPTMRQCTSDLKRGPIQREVRRHAKEVGNPLIVQCIGIRGEESCNRAKATPFQFSESNSKAGREWYEFLPIHDWKIDEVYAAIQSVGQHVHWAYRKGMSRLSCSFCIMARVDDLRRAAVLRPNLYRKYVEKEVEINHTFLMPRKGKAEFLPERIGIQIN